MYLVFQGLALELAFRLPISSGQGEKIKSYFTTRQFIANQPQDILQYISLYHFFLAKLCFLLGPLHPAYFSLIVKIHLLANNALVYCSSCSFYILLIWLWWFIHFCMNIFKYLLFFIHWLSCFFLLFVHL